MPGESGENRRRYSIGRFELGDSQGAILASGLREQKDLKNRKGSPRTSASTKPIKDTKSTQQKKPFSWRKFLKRYPWSPALVIGLVVVSWWFLVARDDPSHWLNALVKVSYPLPGTNPTQYGKGPRDFAFLGFYVVVFTFLREFCVGVILPPFAHFFGLHSRHKVSRFLEQAYSLLYYGIMGPLGLFIMKYKSPELWYFRTLGFYEDFPHKTHDIWFKSFYMLQASFWVQQLLVLSLHLEKRRRDFKELVFHHLVTVVLIWTSYRFHFTHIGLAVYITMDVSDFFLALSKLLNYIESPAVVPFFFLFVAMWIYLRHYLNLRILWSILTEFRTVGPFDLNWETQQYKCWISQVITFGLLLALQLVNLYWLILVFRVAYRYVAHNVKEDVRSDSEGEPVESNDE